MSSQPKEPSHAHRLRRHPGRRRPVPARRSRPRHEIVAVVTREDAPLGRKRVLTPSPVAEAAERLGLPVDQGEPARRRR